jgi:hypothetical protein
VQYPTTYTNLPTFHQGTNTSEENITHKIVNPESASWYDWQYVVKSCDAADTLQKTKHNGVFFELLS